MISWQGRIGDVLTYLRTGSSPSWLRVLIAAGRSCLFRETGEQVIGTREPRDDEQEVWECLTGCAALRCLACRFASWSMFAQRIWLGNGRRTAILLLSRTDERTSSLAHRSSNLTVGGLPVYLCPGKESSWTETVVLGAMQLKRLGHRG